ncbi:hypothetical protein H2248_007137 [Termitomyces sp. 'cryptogamus']|nr:hypothetical protein H2248_007137 [Termitomyces sp. 'cryptogamus']
MQAGAVISRQLADDNPFKWWVNRELLDKPFLAHVTCIPRVKYVFILSMFIPPSFIFPGLHAQDRTLIDKISEWFSRLLTQIEHFLAENYNNLSKWAISIARAANEPLQRHPYVAIFVSLLLCLGPWIFLLPLFLFQALIFTIFYILGLGSSAIVGGSPTDLYQAFCYGGHTPAHSMLVMLQSAGTHYNEDTVNHRLFLAIRLAAGAIGTYIFIAFIVS